MRILFLNQFFPPDPAPTGLLLHEIAEAARARGAEVCLIASGQAYRSEKKDSGRLARELAALHRIFLRALRAPRPDVVVSGSSPPCLLVVADIVARWQHARSIHWAMDLYPDLAVALGQMRSGMVAACFRRLMRAAYRRADAVVALDADMAGILRRYGVVAEEIRPWVPAPLCADAAAPPRRGPGLLWLYSGNLGRAHEWRTLLDAQALLERGNCPATLRFQGSGGGWQPARDYAATLGLRRCEWHPYAPATELRASLLAADVLVATQKPEAAGLLWPSKLALLLDLPRPILWVGRTDGAVARLLRGRPQNGIFAPGDARGVAGWLGALAGSIQAPVPPMESAAATRQRLLARWLELLNLHARGACR